MYLFIAKQYKISKGTKEKLLPRCFDRPAQDFPIHKTKLNFAFPRLKVYGSAKTKSFLPEKGKEEDKCAEPRQLQGIYTESWTPLLSFFGWMRWEGPVWPLPQLLPSAVVCSQSSPPSSGSTQRGFPGLLCQKTDVLLSCLQPAPSLCLYLKCQILPPVIYSYFN